MHIIKQKRFENNQYNYSYYELLLKISTLLLFFIIMLVKNFQMKSHNNNLSIF